MCSEEMTTGEIHGKEAYGFASLVQPPGSAVGPGPAAKYKMALLTWLFHRWLRPLLILVSLLLLVPAMTCVLMPWLTRLFRSWLYPGSAARRPVTRRFVGK
jgi:antibiotic biosynthesis monooxygenase (ABM) superfamily enzyme